MPLDVLILHSSGVLLFDRKYGEIRVEVKKDLFSGLISAIMSFMREVTSSDVKYLMTEEHEVFISRRGDMIAVFIVRGEYNRKALESGIIETVCTFVEKYGKMVGAEGIEEISAFKSFADELDAILLKNGLISEDDIAAAKIREVLESVSTGELPPDRAMGVISNIKENIKYYRVYGPSTPRKLKNAVIRTSTNPVTVLLLENIDRGFSVAELTEALKRSGFEVTPDDILDTLESLRARGIVKIEKYKFPTH